MLRLQHRTSRLIAGLLAAAFCFFSLQPPAHGEKETLKAGITSHISRVYAPDSTRTDGGGLTGLTSASGGLTCYYIRLGDSSMTAVTLTTATVGTYTSSGFKEVDAVHAPGLYELDLPNAAFAAGSQGLLVYLQGATNMVPVVAEWELVSYDPQDAVRMGQTALPNAAAGAANGLLTYGTGTAQLNPSSGNLPSLTTVATGTAQAGAASTITLAVSGSSTTTDLYKGDFVAVVSGTGAGQSRVITGYVGGTLVATVSRAWVTNPDNTSVYVVIANPHPAMDANLAVTAGTVSDKTGYALSQVFPTNFGNLAITGGGAMTAGTVSDKTGYALTQSFPSNFASLAITGGGAVTAGTVSDKTGYALTAGEHTAIATDTQTGLTAQGYTSARATKVDNLDVAVTTRLATSGYTVPPTVAQIRTDLDANSTKLAHLDADISTRLATSGYTAPTDPWAIAVPGSYSAGSAGYVLGTNLDATVTSRLSTSTFSGGSAPSWYVDLWGVTLPGSYGAGSAGALLGALIPAPTAGANATAVWAAGSRTLTSAAPPTTSQIATAILATPNNLLATDTSGRVTVGSVATAALTSIATAVWALPVDGTMPAGQLLTCAGLGVVGKYAVPTRTVSGGVTTIVQDIYRADGTAKLATLTATSDSTGKPLARAVTFYTWP